jgi:uncharacterized pyridoxamine 5'-phosphate oxidase family protein
VEGRSMSEIVEEALGYLKPISVSYVATCVDNQPYVRAMMLIYHNGRIYYTTGSTDTKVDQINRNSLVEIFIHIDDNDGGLRLRGEMSFVADKGMRAEIHGCADFIKGFWETPQDPDFV